MIKENSFILNGDICYSKSLSSLLTVNDGYLVCVDGKSEGVFPVCLRNIKTFRL
jgi:guanine deaminase